MLFSFSLPPVTLPTPAAPVANYVPFVRTGTLLTVSGQLCFGADGKLVAAGQPFGYNPETASLCQDAPAFSPDSRWLAAAWFALLGVHAAAPLMPGVLTHLVDAGLAAGMLLFAVATLRLQWQRRRKLPDITLDYWRFGMVGLIAGVVVWFIAQLSPAWAASDAYPLLLGVLFIGGFAVSVVSGMLYKIVPFLAWFHLQAQRQARAGSIPTMKEMIAERWLRNQFRLHLASCALLIGAVQWPQLAAVAGSTLALSALLQWINLLSAALRFFRYGGRLS